MCGSRKYPYPPRKGMEIPGVGGVIGLGISGGGGEGRMF